MADENQPAASPPDDESDATLCATCGARIDTTVWYPVATHVDDADEFHLYEFCCTECRDDWVDE